ncbi:hypothetical protein [Teredinibacter haidensis]|uniref:hypothetical protein n=1 Tax=Teredinibacter haidensis TaxID=2731755 RepID=UPI0009490393|nr:hypothetical protein [Teredinibacter haidensis]
MKKIVTVVFVVVAIVIDAIFEYFGVPIVIMDLFLTAIGIAVVVWVCTPKYLSGQYIDWHQVQSSNIYFKVALIANSLPLAPLGVFMIYIGISSPFELYIGVKGGCHGYSLIAVGLAIAFFIVSTTYVYFFKRHATKR